MNKVLLAALTLKAAVKLAKSVLAAEISEAQADYDAAVLPYQTAAKVLAKAATAWRHAARTCAENPTAIMWTQHAAREKPDEYRAQMERTDIVCDRSSDVQRDIEGAGAKAREDQADVARCIFLRAEAAAHARLRRSVNEALTEFAESTGIRLPDLRIAELDE